MLSRSWTYRLDIEGTNVKGENSILEVELGLCSETFLQ